MEVNNIPFSHPIEGLMRTAMDSIKQMVDVNTVIGDPVETKDGTVIIPISQVGCGFAAGGGEYVLTDAKQTEHPFAGGSGAGVSVRPIGFLIVRSDDVRLISVNSNQLAERIVDLAPQLFTKLQEIIEKREQNKENTEVPMG